MIQIQVIENEDIFVEDAKFKINNDQKGSEVLKVLTSVNKTFKLLKLYLETV